MDLKKGKTEALKEVGPEALLSKLFFYDDYRCFLSDFFTAQKETRKFFSHRYFAQKAGLSSPSFILDVTKGKFNLTMKTLPRMIKGLGLSGKAAIFFEHLVWYNQAKQPDEKVVHRKAIIELRRSSKLYRLNKEHYKYFEDYIFAVIRELACFAPWQGDFKRLGNLMVPEISEKAAREAVKILCDTGLLVKLANDRYKQSNSGLSSISIPATITKPYRRQFLQFGMDAVERLGPDERFCTHTTMSMSKDSYAKATEILNEAREKVIKLAIDDQNVEHVYELIFQMFPMSKEF